MSSPIINVSDEFIDYLLNKRNSLTSRVCALVRDRLLDYVAVAYAGAKSTQTRWMDFFPLKARDIGVVPLIGLGAKTDGKTASYVNGFNAHTLELDDGQRFAAIHLSASIISALISAYFERGLTERNLELGIVMGYECACRIAESIQPSHKVRGFHASGSCGTIGAALGCGFALGYNREQLKRALTASASSAVGILEIQEQGSELKAHNLGRAALDGLTSAYLGACGFVPPEDILGGARGYLRLFADDFSVERLLESKDYFEIERMYVKPYSACRHCHPSIECALRLRDQISLDEIERLDVFVYRSALKGHDRVNVATSSSAKLSVPYCVAAAFVCGRADPSIFEESTLKRADARLLASKTYTLEDPRYTEVSAVKRPSRVEATLKDGRVVSEEVEYAKGEPENPMSQQELQNKARAIAPDLFVDFDFDRSVLTLI